MADAQIGFGSDFLRGVTSVGEVLSITPPSLTRDVVDATHMKSTEGWREYISALRDGGEVSVEIQSKPSSTAFQALVADLADDDPVSYSIGFPDGSSWTFSAFLTGLESTDPLDDRITSTATFKITGKPVFAAS
ncbi:phage tail tube protein [Primorskyibacter sp. 2E107]|uniref:phage tail tube protein n=1 Tax=Primorskyibacter sp. 2E107 TaxID=3403458 RepID=UPI003AF90956